MSWSQPIGDSLGTAGSSGVRQIVSRGTGCTQTIPNGSQGNRTRTTKGETEVMSILTGIRFGRQRRAEMAITKSSGEADGYGDWQKALLGKKVLSERLLGIWEQQQELWAMGIEKERRNFGDCAFFVIHTVSLQQFRMALAAFLCHHRQSTQVSSGEVSSGKRQTDLQGIDVINWEPGPFCLFSGFNKICSWFCVLPSLPSFFVKFY